MSKKESGIKYCLFSNDVEAHSIWFNQVRDETAEKVIKEGLPLLLDIYRRYDIRTTFNFTGHIATRFPEVVKMVLPDGHEVGSHGLSHSLDHAFDNMSFESQVKHLSRTKKILEDLSGQEVITFRAPALRVNRDTAGALAEAGYRIDSSISSQRFDMFLSFGGLKKLKWLTAPRLPYRTREDNLFKRGNGQIVEVPISAFGLPYIGTTLRMFPFFTRIQHRFLHWENSMSGKPIVFDIHPNEFLNEETEKRTIHRRTKNLFNYLLSDLLRSKFKVRNLGRDAVPLYTAELDFFKKRDYRFCSIQDYCRETGLLS